MKKLFISLFTLLCIFTSCSTPNQIEGQKSNLVINTFYDEFYNNRINLFTVDYENKKMTWNTTVYKIIKGENLQLIIEEPSTKDDVSHLLDFKISENLKKITIASVDKDFKIIEEYGYSYFYVEKK